MVLLVDLTCKKGTCTFCFLPVHGNTLLIFQSPHVRDSGIREIFACGIWNPGKFNGLWNLESWALESGLQLKQSGILLMIHLKTKTQCPESGIQGIESSIQDCLGFRYMGTIPLFICKELGCSKNNSYSPNVRKVQCDQNYSQLP